MSAKRRASRREARRAEAASDVAARLESKLSRRALTFWVAGLLAAMAAMRAAYLVELGGHLVESSDTAYFVDNARRIASGDLLLSGTSFLFSPLYGYFLGLLFAIVGERFVWVLAVQFALGVLGAWLLYRLARSLFGPLAALLTLGLTAFYGLSFIYEGQILDAFFSMLLPTIFLSLLYRAGSGTSTWHWVAGGAALGLFALTRPNVMLFIPGALAWAWFAEGGKAPRPRRVRAAAALVAGVALAILPFTVRNWMVTGEPVLITAHGGINFYVGNNERATGFFTPPPGFPPMPGLFNREIPRQVAEASTGHSGMTDAQVSDYWLERGMSFIREHPHHFVRLTLRKARAFLNGYEVPLNVDYTLMRQISTSLKFAFVPLAVVLPLGLVGMAVAAREWRRHLLFLLYFVAYSLSVILFFVTARYRLPIVPVLLLYAGFCLRFFLAAMARPGQFVAIAVSLAVAALLVNSNLGLQFNEAYVAHSRAFTLEGLGRTDAAIALYEKALGLNPDLLYTHIQLARIYARRGQVDRAEAHYAAAARLAPGDTVLRDEIDAFRLHLPRGR